jgi:hypothetical protein
MGPGKKPAPTPSPPKKRKQGRLKPGAVESWNQDVEVLDNRDEVLGATLSFIDETFGPSIFLARKGKGLGGWNCSDSFRSGIGVDVHSIVVSPPAPREIWHSIERKRGMMGPISVKSEYPFLEELLTGGSSSILVVPVVIRGMAVGVFLSVLRDTWTATPALRNTLETMGMVLSEKLEEILRNRKKSQGK